MKSWKEQIIYFWFTWHDIAEQLFLCSNNQFRLFLVLLHHHERPFNLFWFGITNYVFVYLNGFEENSWVVIQLTTQQTSTKFWHMFKISTVKSVATIVSLWFHLFYHNKFTLIFPGNIFELEFKIDYNFDYYPKTDFEFYSSILKMIIILKLK